ncbi:MAG: hypothetical protein CM1200mP12_07020 [Gammaproteobacteria bacterium]|nr:MAG: hypothetical protein CM1200mP12_07020 [Gammaproteobacteria bacterium]
MVEINIGSEEWLAQVKEDIVEPDIRIIDPHHHLWDDRGSTYLVKDLQADTGSGHNVLKTVYMECGWGYKEDGPRHLKVIGETEAVVDQANKSKETGEAVISAIVSRADLRLGEEVIEVLEAHEEASQGLFRGIRHAGLEPNIQKLSHPRRCPRRFISRWGFLKGMNVLGRKRVYL